MYLHITETLWKICFLRKENILPFESATYGPKEPLNLRSEKAAKFTMSSRGLKLEAEIVEVRSVTGN